MINKYSSIIIIIICSKTLLYDDHTDTAQSRLHVVLLSVIFLGPLQYIFYVAANSDTRLCWRFNFKVQIKTVGVQLLHCEKVERISTF